MNFTFDGHTEARRRGIRVLNHEELQAGDVSLEYVSQLMHRRYTDSPTLRKVLQTLWYQVNNGQEIYVVGVILDDGTVRGGTGWGAEFAKLCNKPLFVFDQEKDGWFDWTGDDWKAATRHAGDHATRTSPAPARARSTTTASGDRGAVHEVVRVALSRAHRSVEDRTLLSSSIQRASAASSSGPIASRRASTAADVLGALPGRTSGDSDSVRSRCCSASSASIRAGSASSSRCSLNDSFRVSAPRVRPRPSRLRPVRVRGAAACAPRVGVTARLRPSPALRRASPARVCRR